MSCCCFCGLPVLGIRGQYQYLESYVLDMRSPLCNEFLSENIYGEVHTACLEKSGWMNFWNEQLVNHHLNVLGAEMIYSEADMSILSFSHLDEFVFVHNRRGSCCLDNHDIEKLVSDNDGGGSISTLSEVSMEVPKNVHAANIEKALKSQGNMPLIDVVRMLGIEKTFLYFEKLDSSKIMPYADSPESTFKLLRNGMFGGLCLYELYLGTEFNRAISAVKEYRKSR